MGNIYAKYAHPNNGYKNQQVEINRVLKVRELYEVKSIEMGDFQTDVYLKNIFQPLNSVFFDFYENGKEIDIYTDKRFNPMIKQTAESPKVQPGGGNG